MLLENVINKDYSEDLLVLHINYISRHNKNGNIIKTEKGKFYDKKLLDAGATKEEALITDIYQFALNLHNSDVILKNKLFL